MGPKGLTAFVIWTAFHLDIHFDVVGLTVHFHFYQKYMYTVLKLDYHKSISSLFLNLVPQMQVFFTILSISSVN